jgi:hypothetical protein
MRPRAFVISVTNLVAIALAFISPCPAADISAEMSALLSDVLRPYQMGAPVPAGVDPQVFARTLAILKKEGLVGLPRPATGTTDIADRFGKALALGTRTLQFLSEIGAVYDALTRGDAQAAGEAIRTLYRKAGRTPPQGAALEKLYNDVQAAHNEARQVEQVEITRPDYSITVAHRGGKIHVDVVGQKGPDGKPFRTVFDGDVVTRPDASSKNLELAANPASAPRTISPEQAAELRSTLNGKWNDGNGNIWEIAGSGESITLTEIRTNTGHRLVYKGRYDLGKIYGEHIVDDAKDMNFLPDWVAQQVAANFKPPFRIKLDISAAADQMEGTWASQNVTYNEMESKVKSVQDWFHEPRILSRPKKKARIS